jgi:hypothetical protein
VSGFALDGWGLVGALLIVGALCLLLGAALGYFTASTDLQQERANAWERGFRDLRAAVERTWIPPTTLLAKVRNPYLKRPLAPEPPHLVIPTPDLLSADQARTNARALFNQDAPTEAARAIELRGDD